MKQAPGVYSFDGVTPVIDPSAYVHPGATLIGDVIIGPGCFVAAGAVLRGDFGRIVMERESNLQDNCVVHTLSDFDCVLAEHSHIGHGAVVHAAHVGRGVLVGMVGYVISGWRVPNLPEYSLGFVYLPALLAIVAASVLTAPFGARLAHRLPVATMKRVFALLLYLLATKMVVSYW